MSVQQVVLVFNNYSLERVGREVVMGHKPAHHLFGLDHLAAKGLMVVHADAGEERPSAVERFFRRCGLGPLRNLFSALDHWNKAALIYAPCQTETGWVALFKNLKPTRAKLAVVYHHPPGGGKLALLRESALRLHLAGTDCSMTLGSHLAQKLKRFCPQEKSLTPLAWGPELGFYNHWRRAPDRSAAYVATGRTGRDFSLLARAAEQARTPLRIFGLNLEGIVETTFVKRISVRSEADLDYQALLDQIVSSPLHCIPLVPGGALCGMTSLTDALALGRAVFMTRNHMVDINIEKLGFGRWIEPGDEAGWTAALRWAHDHPFELLKMGVRAREYAEQERNYGKFCSELWSALEPLLAEAAVS